MRFLAFGKGPKAGCQCVVFLTPLELSLSLVSFLFLSTNDRQRRRERPASRAGRKTTFTPRVRRREGYQPPKHQSTMKRKVTKDHAILLSFWNRMPVFRLTNFPFQRLVFRWLLVPPSGRHAFVVVCFRARAVSSERSEQSNVGEPQTARGCSRPRSLT